MGGSSSKPKEAKEKEKDKEKGPKQSASQQHRVTPVAKKPPDATARSTPQPSPRQAAGTASTSTLRIASCVSGAPHSLVDPRVLSHWVAAFAPLRHSPGLRLDVLLHLDGSTHPLRVLHRVAVTLNASSLELYNVPTRNASLSKERKGTSSMRDANTLDGQLRKTHGSVSDLKCAGPVRCVQVGDKECMTTGYEQAVKWRGCLRDIERHEHHAGTYAFVLRLRPDLEFGAEFPKAIEWFRLRRDVVMTMVANGVNEKRLDGSVAARISFLDDGLALLPRRAATAYFGVADAFEACIPPCPPLVPLFGQRGMPNSLQRCMPNSTGNVGRWRWAEYRVLFALSQVQPPLSFAEFPSTRPGWAIVDDCPQPCYYDSSRDLIRRKGIASVWGGARFPAHALLSTDLPTSSFSPATLLTAAEFPCVGPVALTPRCSRRRSIDTGGERHSDVAEV